MSDDRVSNRERAEDVKHHCAQQLKEYDNQQEAAIGAAKETMDGNNHVVLVHNACGLENKTAMPLNDEASDPAQDSPTNPSPSNASNCKENPSQSDSSLQDDSGVRVDIETDVTDSTVKFNTSSFQGRTDEAVKLKNDCSMMPFPDNSADSNLHSDCSSSSRSSKDIFMDAQEDICSNTSRNNGEGNTTMSRKDDSGIGFEKTPKKSEYNINTNSVAESHGAGSSHLMEQFQEELDDFYSSLPSGASSRDNPSAAESFVVDFDTSSDTGKAASYEVTRPLHSDSDSEDMSNMQIRRRKRVRSRNRLSSSSSSSTKGPDEEGDDEEEETKKSSDEEEEMETENDRVPRGKWHPVLQTRKREIGFSNTVPLSYMFARTTNSSLSLVQRLKLQYKLEHHDGCVNALHFNKSGTLLASGSDDMNIVLWRWDQNKPYIVFESGHRSNVFQAKFMPYSGDTHIVSCARDGMVRLAELSSTGICKGTKKLAQHKGAAHKLAIQQDASHLFYSCGEDAVTYEIDLRQDKPNKLCTTKSNDKRISLYSIHANPFKSYEFVVGGRDHFVRIYDKRMLGENDGKPVKKFCPHHLVDSDIKANVTCAVYNYNGTEVLGTYNDEDIYLFDNDHSDGADFIKRYKGHRNNATVKGVNFYGAHSEYVISGSDCGNVFLWDKDTEKCVQYFHGDDGGVINVLEPHPHFPILATSGLDHDVKVWVPTAHNPTELEGLRELMVRNRRERREERIHMDGPEMMDGQMLWLLMQHLRRTSRRSARGEGEEVSSSSSNSDHEEDNSDDSDDDGDSGAPVSCVQS